ncbi:MAG: hypothetical protein MI976_20190 [Pseudomonadales bacterium]|nr:hypothetical protein [Pseudomonadales bacterium]
MATTRHIVEEELGCNETASLISAAIQILSNENYAGSALPYEKVIHLTWKAKHLVDANLSLLRDYPIYEQHNIIKLYLEGQSIEDFLDAPRPLEAAIQC